MNLQEDLISKMLPYIKISLNENFESRQFAIILSFSISLQMEAQSFEPGNIFSVLAPNSFNFCVREIRFPVPFCNFLKALS